MVCDTCTLQKECSTASDALERPYTVAGGGAGVNPLLPFQCLRLTAKILPRELKLRNSRPAFGRVHRGTLGGGGVPAKPPLPPFRPPLPTPLPPLILPCLLLTCKRLTAVGCLPTLRRLLSHRRRLLSHRRRLLSHRRRLLPHRHRLPSIQCTTAGLCVSDASLPPFYIVCCARPPPAR